MDNTIDRRALFRGALGVAAASLLTACGGGGGPSSGGVSNAGKQLVPWPAYVPFAGPTPDAPATTPACRTST